jgi:hypothetical protein
MAVSSSPPGSSISNHPQRRSCLRRWRRPWPTRGTLDAQILRGPSRSLESLICYSETRSVAAHSHSVLLSLDLTDIDIQSDPSDPFTHFYKFIEDRIDQISNPVAFATAPLQVATPPPPPREHVREAYSTAPLDPPSSPTHVTESFYLVPSASTSTSNSPPTRTDSAAFLPSSSVPAVSRQQHQSRNGASSPPTAMANTKTREELALENASLKSALNSLSLEYERRNRERDRMRNSIADFGRDVRREVEGVSGRAKELEREVERLRAEAETQKAERDKQVRRSFPSVPEWSG